MDSIQRGNDYGARTQGGAGPLNPARGVAPRLHLNAQVLPSALLRDSLGSVTRASAVESPSLTPHQRAFCSGQDLMRSGAYQRDEGMTSPTRQGPGGFPSRPKAQGRLVGPADYYASPHAHHAGHGNDGLIPLVPLIRNGGQGFRPVILVRQEEPQPSGECMGGTQKERAPFPRQGLWGHGGFLVPLSPTKGSAVWGPLRGSGHASDLTCLIPCPIRRQDRTCRRWSRTTASAGATPGGHWPRRAAAAAGAATSRSCPVSWAGTTATCIHPRPPQAATAPTPLSLSSPAVPSSPRGPRRAPATCPPPPHSVGGRRRSARSIPRGPPRG